MSNSQLNRTQQQPRVTVQPPAPATFPDPVYYQVLAEVQALRQEVHFWRLANQNALYFTRQQAMIFLSVGSTKLWALKKDGVLAMSGALYEVESCRQYLESRSYSNEGILKQLEAALAVKKR